MCRRPPTIASSRTRIRDILLCSDSKPGLQLLSRGPTSQQTALALRVWRLLETITSEGASIHLQWIPGHAGIDDNEAADRLANRAAATCEQGATPVDLPSARSAIRRWSEQMAEKRAAHHTLGQRTPGHDDLDCWGQTTLSQLRTGRCTLVRSTLHRIGLASDSTCRDCGADEDTVKHLLAEWNAPQRPGAESGAQYQHWTKFYPDQHRTTRTSRKGWGGRLHQSIRPRLPRHRARHALRAQKKKTSAQQQQRRTPPLQQRLHPPQDARSTLSQCHDETRMQPGQPT